MRKIMLSTVAAVALVGAMSIHTPARAAGSLPTITQDTAKAEVFDAGKTVGVLIVGTAEECKDCAAAEGLLADNAAAHAGDKFVKLVQEGATDPAFLVFVPGSSQPVYEAGSFHPTASDIGAVLTDVDGIASLVAQRVEALKPTSDKMAALKAEFATFVQPYKDRLAEQRTKFAADPKVTAAKADIDAQKAKMGDDAAYKAAQAQVDAIYAKAGATDLVAAAKKAEEAGDIGAYIQAMGQLQPKLEPYSDELKTAQEALDTAAKPFQDAIQTDEQAIEAAAQPYQDASDAIQQEAQDAIGKSDFQARAQAIHTEASQATADIDAKIAAATSALDGVIQTEQPAEPAQK